MFLAIENYLQDYRMSMSIADVFAIAGKDPGFLEKRYLPE